VLFVDAVNSFDCLPLLGWSREMVDDMDAPNNQYTVLLFNLTGHFCLQPSLAGIYAARFQRAP